MNLSKRVLAAAGLAAGLVWIATSANGGRFGGGGGSQAAGGGFHAGNFQAGGGGFHPSQPMSRPAQFSRPAAQTTPVSLGGAHGPYGGGAVSRSQTLNLGGSAASRSQTLNLGGGGAGQQHVWQTPRGGTVVGGGAQHSFTGTGGTTVSGGSGRYIYSGPHGATAIGGGKGATVTGPGGKTISGGEKGSVLIGPNGNVHAAGEKGAVAQGPSGAAIAGSKGAVTVGPGGAVASGGRGAAVTGRGGTAIAGQHGAVAVGPYGAVGRGSNFVAGRSASGGYYGTRYINSTTLINQRVTIQQNFNTFNNFNHFTPGWYNRYPGAWYAGSWAAGAAWRAATWPSALRYVGYPVATAPVYYNYGDNVTYQDGSVYYGDQPVATEAQYAQQATQIVDVGRQASPADDEQWQPLGVFALAVGDETTSNDIFQLALSKDGVVRGNYYNAISDSTTPVYGSLDKKTQRLAWSIGNKKTPVYETGLYNLTQEQTTLLAHLSPERTEQFKLFRIEQPREESANPAP